MPLKNAQLDAGGTSRHEIPEPPRAAHASAASQFVLFSPLRDDLPDGVGGAVASDPPGHRHRRHARDRARPGDRGPGRPRRSSTALAVGARSTRGIHPAGRSDGAAEDAGLGRSDLRRAGRDDPRPRAPDGGAPHARHGQPVDPARGVRRAAGLDGASRSRRCWARSGCRGAASASASGRWRTWATPRVAVPLPTFPQGRNAVEAFIPVARVSDMLLGPGRAVRLRRRPLRVPGHPAGLLGGRQPVPPPPGPDAADGGLRAARHGDRPRAVLDRDRAPRRHRPAGDDHARARRHRRPRARTSTWSRCTAVVEPFGEARDDYAILAGLARELGVRGGVHRGPDARRVAARTSMSGPATRPRGDGCDAARRSTSSGHGGEVALPTGRTDRRRVERLPRRPGGRAAADAQRPDRAVLRRRSPASATPTARPPGLARADRVARRCARGPLPARPDREPAGAATAQPARLRGAQPRRQGRRARGAADQPGRCRGARASRTATSCGFATTAARCLAAARRHRRRASRASSSCRPGRGTRRRSSTAASPASTATPTRVTSDRGTSRLAQGSTGQHCLVEVERYDGPIPTLDPYSPPPITSRR